MGSPGVSPTMAARPNSVPGPQKGAESGRMVGGLWRGADVRLELGLRRQGGLDRQIEGPRVQRTQIQA